MKMAFVIILSSSDSEIYLSYNYSKQKIYILAECAVMVLTAHECKLPISRITNCYYCVLNVSQLIVL